MLAWWPVERLGTKTTLYAAQVCLGIACTIEVLARNWSAWLASKILFVGRCFIRLVMLTSKGIAAGLTQCAAIHYVVDISPTKIRGALLCLYPFMVSLQTSGSFSSPSVCLGSAVRYRRNTSDDSDQSATIPKGLVRSIPFHWVSFARSVGNSS